MDSIKVEENKRTGGESGIRTHVRVSPKHAFQACAFSHSAISPTLFREATARTMNATTLFDFMVVLVEPQPGVSPTLVSVPAEVILQFRRAS